MATRSTMRNQTIDVARGIGILLVVLGHNWLVTNQGSELSKIIFSFHVPLFFFISGIFLSTKKTLSETTRQKANSLLKPYFVVMPFVAVLQGIQNHTNIIYNLTGVIFATGQGIYWIPLWFLPHLFITFVFSRWVLGLIENKKHAQQLYYAVILFLLGIGILSIQIFSPLDLTQFGIKTGQAKHLVGLPFSADLIFISAAYLLAGSKLSPIIKNFQPNHWLMLCAATIFISCHVLFDVTMNLNYRVYGNPIISTIQATMGIYLVFNIASLILKLSALSKLLSYIGSGSLFILIFHSVLQGKATSRMQLLIPNHPLFDAVIGLIAAVICSLLLWELAKRIPLAARLLLDKY